MSPQTSTAGPMSLSNLPFEVIAAILSHVPLKERLSTCALVCSNWAAAAASSSKTLVIHLRSQVQADNLAAWLVQHGPSIEHLSACSDQAAFQESLLQWQIQRRQGQRNAGDVVVKSGPGISLFDYELPPRPPKFMLRLPWQQLQALRRLHVEHIRLRPATTNLVVSNPAPDPAAGSSTSSRTMQGAVNTPTATPASADAACSSSTPPRLAHLHIDSSFIHLPEALQGRNTLLSSLQTLKITPGTDNPYSTLLWAKDATTAFQELAAHCRSLQKLLLSSSLLTPAALQAVEGMKQLQHLELHVPRGTRRRPAGLQGWLQHVQVVQQLTHLVLKPVVLEEAEKMLDLSLTSISTLSHLTRLLHLDVAHGLDLDPRVLAPLSNLTHLRLDDIDLSAAHATQLQQGPAGSAPMLSALACLTQLQVLQLSPGLLPAPHAPVEQYSALTASSHLTFLSLYHCSLPPGAATAMFPLARPGALPALASLRMPRPPAGGATSVSEALNARSPFLSGHAASVLRAAQEAAHGGPSNGLPFGPGSIDGLVAACPNLSQLWLTAAVGVGCDLGPLARLTGLTELQCGGLVVADAVCESLLARLTQLRRLDLTQCPRLSDAGLVYLTALRALTSLQVSGGLSHVTGGLQNMLYMCRRQEGCAGSTPVWERLQQQCLNSRDCLLVMLKQRDQQLVEAAAALQAAEARAGAAEARAAAAESKAAGR